MDKFTRINSYFRLKYNKGFFDFRFKYGFDPKMLNRNELVYYKIVLKFLNQ